MNNNKELFELLHSNQRAIAILMVANEKILQQLEPATTPAISKPSEMITNTPSYPRRTGRYLTLCVQGLTNEQRFMLYQTHPATRGLTPYRAYVLQNEIRRFIEGDDSSQRYHLKGTRGRQPFAALHSELSRGNDYGFLSVPWGITPSRLKRLKEFLQSKYGIYVDGTDWVEGD